MQPCLPAPKARRFWRVRRALSTSGPATWIALQTPGPGNGMAETTEKTGEKKLSVGSTKTLTLKPRVEQSGVRQNFSHGRTKQVVGEKVKTRTLGKAKAGAPAAAPVAPAAGAATAKRPGAPATTGKAAPANTAAAVAAKPSGVVLQTLTAEE